MSKALSISDAGEAIMTLDLTLIGLYLLAVLGVGWLGWRRAKTRDDYAVAGRRLAPLMFTGTMASTVLGGASTLGSIGLGYQYGLSGLWLATSLGCGLIVLSLFLVTPLLKLKLHTVTQMLAWRYHPQIRIPGALMMMLYDLMVAVTSVIAIGTILEALLGLPFLWAVWVGGGVVVGYVFLGGMWSLTITDIFQFIMMTLGLLFILMPASVIRAGGWEAMQTALPASFFSLIHIGWPTILTWFLIYSLGILIGQDIWQRVFTARSARCARWGGVSAGLYCIVWGVMGAVIGMSCRVIFPNISNPDTVFMAAVEGILPVGLRGIVIAASLAALMSTASACMMATSTLFMYDLYPSLSGKAPGTLTADRRATLFFGLLILLLASLIADVLTALTVAYNILVGILLIPLIGAISWKRASTAGAMWAMALSACTLLFFMARDGLMANSATWFALLVNLLAFVGISLLHDPHHAE
ncbi:MAG: sodium:solute symporter [Scandinavium sp.]|uniref:sodium:solute symporter n=1 Tax=Scandinavium sp. TaxID=2830653 RepID=UPI003F3864B6